MSTSAFLTAIFTSGVTATPSDINVIATEKLNPDNIGRLQQLEFYLYVPLETKQPLT